MKGEQFARIIEQLLAERGIAKGKFYADIGISATALYGWKRGAEPKRETIEAVEKYFGVSLANFDKSESESDELREMHTFFEVRISPTPPFEKPSDFNALH